MRSLKVVSVLAECPSPSAAPDIPPQICPRSYWQSEGKDILERLDSAVAVFIIMDNALLQSGSISAGSYPAGPA